MKKRWRVRLRRVEWSGRITLLTRVVEAATAREAEERAEAATDGETLFSTEDR